MTFQLRSVDEIKRDISAAKTIADEIAKLSWKAGLGGNLREAAALVYQNPPTEGYRVVSMWLYHGAQTVFFQDADSLIMKTRDLVEVIKFLKETFPNITRITSYGRSKTASHKTLEEFKQIHETGLTRLHIGFESGSEAVLQYVDKGTTPAHHIKGGKRVVQSGISLCAYVMPGVGGRRWSREHVTETARVLNEIGPQFIRLRSLAIREDIPLYQKWASGDFELLTDDEVVEEIKQLILHLNTTSYLASDHIENLLQEVEGQLPQDKAKMLSVIERYQALSPEERLNFQFGQRSGYYRTLDDLRQPSLRNSIDQAMASLDSRGENTEGVILNMKKRFLV
jgi:radical SAM superfamily enzyme